MNILAAIKRKERKFDKQLGRFGRSTAMVKAVGDFLESSPDDRTGSDSARKSASCIIRNWGL